MALYQEPQDDDELVYDEEFTKLLPDGNNETLSALALSPTKVLLGTLTGKFQVIDFEKRTTEAVEVQDNNNGPVFCIVEVPDYDYESRPYVVVKQGKEVYVLDVHSFAKQPLFSVDNAPTI